MQKIFRVRNSSDYSNDLLSINDFLGVQGKVISVTPSRPIDEQREIGSWLVVADNGKEYKEIKDPLE
jgi:hypothetical protein